MSTCWVWGMEKHWTVPKSSTSVKLTTWLLPAVPETPGKESRSPVAMGFPPKFHVPVALPHGTLTVTGTSEPTQASSNVHPAASVTVKVKV